MRLTIHYLKNNLNSLFRKWLTVLIPLIIGSIIIFYQYSTLTFVEIEKIKISFKNANYFYIFLSLLIAIIGHWSRAYRWKFALNHLGYFPKFYNNFLSVLVSYFVNLTVPRSGEISRALLIKKYEEIPFDKAFGTIVGERIVDLLIFFIFVLIGFISQYEIIYHFLIKNNVSFISILFFIGAILVLAIIFCLIWVYAQWNIVLKLKKKLEGLLLGMKTVLKIKKKGYYIFHSFFIWVCYFTMFYIAIYALPETSEISFNVVIMGFVFGSLAIGFSNGGLGAYPFSIALIFSLYGVSKDIGAAFGWLVWSSQTILTIFSGFFSFLLLPILNKK